MSIGIGIGIGIIEAACQGGLSLAAIREQLALRAGAVGLYLPSTFATSAWRRYDATTEIGMVGYPIGFLGDMLQGMSLGPELITNGDFSGGTTGWTAVSATLSVVNGRLRITNTDIPAGYAYQQVINVISLPAFFATTAQSISGTGISQAYVEGGEPAITTGFAIIRVPGAQVRYYRRNAGSVGSYSDHDNCSFRRLLGNHTIQATDGNRPSLLSNGSVYYLSHTSGQKMTAYVPSSLGATCTIVYASPGVGAQVLYNVPVTSNAVALTQNHSGLAILPSSATPEQVAIATAIMGILAWRTVV